MGEIDRIDARSCHDDHVIVSSVRPGARRADLSTSKGALVSRFLKWLLHRLNGNRAMYHRQLALVAERHEGAQILEIGSGKEVDGGFPYSAHHLFPHAGSFVMTDINPAFGHRVLDVTTLDDVEQHDVILCLNVLEHVYDFDLAIANLRRALRPDGLLVVAVPFTFPLHDEPIDFWRFTEHALRRMLADFSDVQVKHQRARRWPTGYFVTARR